MAAEGFDAIECVCIPNAEGFVLGDGANVAGVGGPGEIVNVVRVADEDRRFERRF